MDKMDDNKATPTKKTGYKDENNFDSVSDTEHGAVPEIEQPNHSTATPSIPDEMPVREAK